MSSIIEETNYEDFINNNFRDPSYGDSMIKKIESNFIFTDPNISPEDARAIEDNDPSSLRGRIKTLRKELSSLKNSKRPSANLRLVEKRGVLKKELKILKEKLEDLLVSRRDDSPRGVPISKESPTSWMKA